MRKISGRKFKNIGVSPFYPHIGTQSCDQDILYTIQIFTHKQQASCLNNKKRKKDKIKVIFKVFFCPYDVSNSSQQHHYQFNPESRQKISCREFQRAKIPLNFLQHSKHGNLRLSLHKSNILRQVYGKNQILRKSASPNCKTNAAITTMKRSFPSICELIFEATKEADAAPVIIMIIQRRISTGITKGN